MGKRTAPTQTFICQACNATWTRPAARGQRPKWCPDCRRRAYDIDHTKACPQCKSPGVRRDATYCSPTCYHKAHGCYKGPPTRALVPHPDAAPASILPAKHPARAAPAPTTEGLWVQGLCYRCGRRFTVAWQTTARYCSDACASLVAKARRRAAKRNADLKSYSRVAIFERDNWKCQICGKRTRPDRHHLHDLHPSIDHIVSLADGGADAAWNVQCAHRICNSLKGATSAGQLRLG